jgi:hypothetical protein
MSEFRASEILQLSNEALGGVRRAVHLIACLGFPRSSPPCFPHPLLIPAVSLPYVDQKGTFR